MRPRTRPHHRVHLALTLLLALLFARVVLAMDAETMQRAQLADARAMASDLLPAAADLPGDWRYPWQIPKQLPAAAESPEDWWATAMSDLGPAGLSEATAGQLLDEQLAMLSTAVAEEGMSRRDLMLHMLLGLREANSPPEVKLARALGAGAAGAEEARRAREAATLAEEAAEDSGQAAPPATDGDETTARAHLLALLAGPDAQLGEEALRAALVAELSVADRRSLMRYYTSNNWPAHIDMPHDVGRVLKEKGIWVGIVEVRLMLVNPARLDRYPDLNEAARSRLQGSLGAQLRSIAGTASAIDQFELEHDLGRDIERVERDIRAETDPDKRLALIRIKRQLTQRYQEEAEKVRREAEAREQLAVLVYPRDFGEHCYVIRIVGVAPEAAGMQASLYSAWLRSGRAVVEIALRGNFPATEMDKVMDLFLAEMDARIQPFAEF